MDGEVNNASRRYIGPEGRALYKYLAGFDAGLGEDRAGGCFATFQAQERFDHPHG